MGELLNNEFVTDLAKEMGIDINPDEIDNMLDEVKDGKKDEPKKDDKKEEEKKD